jgi:hypothetical protein
MIGANITRRAKLTGIEGRYNLDPAPDPTTQPAGLRRHLRKESLTMSRKSLDQMIAEAALLPPGPEAWQPIFDAYPEITPEELAKKFREAGERDLEEAEELQQYLRQRRNNPA